MNALSECLFIWTEEFNTKLNSSIANFSLWYNNPNFLNGKKILMFNHLTNLNVNVQIKNSNLLIISQVRSVICMTVFSTV